MVTTVVITGSTRGLGYGLADALLARDCRVVISGRTGPAVDQAVTRLAALYGEDSVLGCTCDVRHVEQVQAQWDAAVARWGQVDIWINSAGVAHPQTRFWLHPPAEIKTVIETNVLGAMYGARVALAGMLAQGSGRFYNMEGLGSDGRHVLGMDLYGATKYSLAYLTDALARQVRGTPIVVGALRPGMVLTDMLTGQYADPDEWQRARRVFNLLANRVEEVVPFLADRVLANQKNGARIRWLTTGRMLRNVLSTLLGRRNLFPDENTGGTKP